MTEEDKTSIDVEVKPEGEAMEGDGQEGDQEDTSKEERSQERIIYEAKPLDRWNKVTDLKYRMNTLLIEQLKYLHNCNRADFDSIILLDGDIEGCQPKGSKVLMANGDWKNIEDVKVNDFVLSPQEDGTTSFSRVIKTTQWYSFENYKIKTLNRGNRDLFRCSHNHILPINFRNSDKKWEVKNFEAKDYALLSKSYQQNMSAITCPAIQSFLGRENCQIEPYALGVFLGDGSLSEKRLNITSPDVEIMEEIGKTYPIMSVGEKEGTYCLEYRFSIKEDFFHNLTELGLSNKKSGDKFIPKQALLSDLDFRKRLLAGLIDSDGYYHNGGYDYTSKSRRLIEDIEFLVRSVGGMTHPIREVKKRIKKLNFEGTYYSIRFYLGVIEIPIITERRKRRDGIFYLSSNRLAVSTELDEPYMVYGFTLDSKSQWYITDNYLLTHNSGKSVMAQQIGYYLAWKSNMPFTIDNIVFTPDEFKERVMAAKPFTAIVWDEAFMGNSKFSMSSKMNITIMSMLQQIRQKNLFIVIVLPYFFDLNSYIAVPRSWYLVHIYMASQLDTGDTLPDGNIDFSKPIFQRGFFRFFDRVRKKKLFYMGRQTYDYTLVKGNFIGMFPRFYTVDEAAYKEKKANIKFEEDKKAMPLKVWAFECFRHGFKAAEILEHCPEMSKNTVYGWQTEFRRVLAKENGLTKKEATQFLGDASDEESSILIEKEDD